MTGTTLFYVSYAALWVIVIFQTLVLLEVVRQAIRRRDQAGGDEMEGREVLQSGAIAPSFEAEDVAAGRVVSSDSWRGRYTLLVFVTPNCPACIEAGKDLEGLRKRVNAQVVVLCRGDASQCRDFGTNYSAGTLILSDEEGTIGERFKVKAAPTAVLLDDEGRVLRYGRPGPGSGLDLVVESIPGEPSGVVG